ncbi:ricin-type beta-trefoil lectin domain protein [Lentzea sp. NPDC006480]|uniref:ricin-type beta-trefoil lectin domain protein n=1 Tax=Lentzea sp. NPDC006480 TaxID=3157176 RepID=UPI0033AC24F4
MFASAALILAGTAASAVGGGTTVGNDVHRYVTKIQTATGACTGSLVAPLWVVTTKNCVPHNADGTPTSAITLTVGRGDLTGTAGRVQQATKVVPRADRDLALVKLSIPVVDVPVLPIATTAPAAGATVQVIGYGRTEDKWVPDKASIAPFTVGALGSASFAITSPSGKDTCKGDAGGPALAGGQLAGITSTSWQHGCLTVTESRQGGTQVRVDDIASWIHQTIDVVPSGPIGGKDDKCVDNANGRIANGNPVQYYGCNGRDTQWWQLRADQTIQLQQKCLDVDSGSTANGTKIQIYSCHTHPAQEFTFGPDESIRAVGKCLDVKNGVNANGSEVQLYDCNGSAAQRWTRNPSDNSLRVFGRCLDIPGAMANDLIGLNIYDCNGSAAQRWDIGGGKIRTFARCMGAAGDRTADGTEIELFDCLGSTGQRWVPADDGSIVNPASGRCLDLREGSTADSTRLQLFACNGRPHQKWKLTV